jgi:hypothetical protein
MKKLIRSLTLAAVAGCFLAPQFAFAGQCCIKAVADAKAGKVCEHSLSKQCCKDAVAKAGVADQSKSCAKCAAIKKKESAKE